MTDTFVFGRRVEMVPLTAAILLGPPGMLVSTTKTIRLTSLLEDKLSVALLSSPALAVDNGIDVVTVFVTSDVAVDTERLWTFKEIVTRTLRRGLKSCRGKLKETIIKFKARELRKGQQ